ncbi:S-phase kinase-associated protein 2 isoform X2 [Tenebrio molitor]|jgi:F-box and leucine-rich repeat protein 1 (S-phase kinase-associated protein 2)|uniref:S-phase kinase-associated protein 2 isoform X2 n=1 Tax=Tenebrio molitor TaxID=7067 RepID=UPI00362478F5
MMATQKMVQPVSVDIDRSPVCKRARYDLDPADANRWTLSKNELILHSVFDSGVERLVADTEFNLESELKRQNVKSARSIETPTSKLEQIAVLEASLPENTLQKLSLGELDNIMLQQGKHFVAKGSDLNYFDLLSDEVILNIFKMLSKAQLGTVALVCRRFSQLAEDESLWTRMDISNRTLEKGAIGTIMSRQVIILRLSRSRIVSPPILPDVKAAFPDYRCRLMYLDLTMATISTSSLVTIFNKCKRLRKLSLESVPVNDNVLSALAANRDIEVLNLAMATGINIDGLKNLLINCRKIKELNLSWTYLNANSIEYICENLPSSLDRFNFSGCRKLLHDQNVIQLVANCPHLRELDLSDCTSITGEAVKKLTALDELNFLSLSRCYLIPYRSLLCLKKMKSLAYLDVHGSYINSDEFKIINDGLGVSVNINKFKFSSIARPTVGVKKSKIWNMQVRD